MAKSRLELHIFNYSTGRRGCNDQCDVIKTVPIQLYSGASRQTSVTVKILIVDHNHGESPEHSVGILCFWR